MALPLLCSGMAHPLTSALPVLRKGMRDLLLCGLGIPRLGPGLGTGAGSALQLVRDLTADAFVNVVAHRFRLSGCCAALRGNPAVAASRSGCASIRRLLRSRKSNTVFAYFTRNGVCLFGWKPLDARRGQRPKPSERRLQPKAGRSVCENSNPCCIGSSPTSMECRAR